MKKGINVSRLANVFHGISEFAPKINRMTRSSAQAMNDVDSLLHFTPNKKLIASMKRFDNPYNLYRKPMSRANKFLIGAGASGAGLSLAGKLLEERLAAKQSSRQGVARMSKRAKEPICDCGMPESKCQCNGHNHATKKRMGTKVRKNSAVPAYVQYQLNGNPTAFGNSMRSSFLPETRATNYAPINGQYKGRTYKSPGISRMLMPTSQSEMMGFGGGKANMWADPRVNPEYRQESSNRAQNWAQDARNIASQDPYTIFNGRIANAVARKNPYVGMTVNQLELPASAFGYSIAKNPEIFGYQVNPSLLRQFGPTRGSATMKRMTKGLKKSMDMKMEKPTMPSTKRDVRRSSKYFE